MWETQLQAYLEAYMDDLIQDISALVAIPSVSHDAQQVARALDAALALARRLGFQARSECGGAVGVVEMGDGPETLGILTHVDVVPAGDEGLWRTPPFQPTVADGALWGRGTIDDKGPLVSCLYAMGAAAQAGPPLRKKVQMIIGTQEEVQWVDMRAYVAAHKLPDYGFTPDGEFPLCNIEKGAARLTITVPLGDTGLLSLEGGTMINAMPNVASWGPIFPGEEDTCHEVNERILLESLRKMTLIYAQAIGTIALSEARFLTPE